ncbi:hypothetical protein SCUCBS95973_009255 [Sporothrix curviconia]|uniref:HNH nuclease domain-containing protein n=1 Tax=Sporothrix curviconia TaxID=1260050 RepID=A0ABP0CV04_9PEZI
MSTVTALGRRSLAWLPTGEEPAVVLAPELEERRRAFVRYIEDKLQAEDNDNNNNNDNDNDNDNDNNNDNNNNNDNDNNNNNDNDNNNNEQVNLRVSFLDGKSVRQAALVVTSDPALADFFLGPLRDDDRNLDGRHLAAWLGFWLADLESKLVTLLGPWIQIHPQNCPRPRPPAPDKKAQSAVRAWYGNKCVLTGVDRTVGAHIVPVVWSDDDLAVGTPSGDAALPEVVNGRCPIDGVAAYPPVCTGDVFLLETADPNNCPLPSVEFLQIQAGVHRILGGLRAAATLTSLFRGPPPDADRIPAAGSGPHATAAAALGFLEEDSGLPHLWQVLLETAVAKNIISLRDAGRWARALVRDVQEKRQALERWRQQHG